jgi:hypothetical protein
MQPRSSSAAEDAELPGWAMLVQVLLSFLVGGVLFVVLWAGLNFVFGTALDTAIGAFFMEQPCQRLAGTTERLTGYTPGRASRGTRSTPSVCHFGSRSVVVAGPTDALGFPEREFQLIVIGLVGYALCFIGAGLATFYLIGQGWRLVGRLIRRTGRFRVERAPPPRRSRRR